MNVLNLITLRFDNAALELQNSQKTKTGKFFKPCKVNLNHKMTMPQRVWESIKCFTVLVFTNYS